MSVFLLAALVRRAVHRKTKQRISAMKKLAAALLCAALALPSLAGAETVKIKVGASPTPHAELLKVANEVLKPQGYEIKIVEYADYVQPNMALDGKELDANYFQHKPYLDDFVKEKGVNLVSIGAVHYEPFGIYAGRSKDLAALKEKAIVAVPNDTTNEARALLLLEANGLITLREGAGLTATVNDIQDNPHNLKIVELEAAQVPRVVGEVAYVVLNGNYALEAGYSVGKDALAYESADSEAAQTYVNVIAVKEGSQEAEKVKALVEALRSQEIKSYIEATYDGAVIPFA